MTEQKEDDFLQNVFEKHGLEQTSSGFTKATLQRLEKQQEEAVVHRPLLGIKAKWIFLIAWGCILALALWHEDEGNTNWPSWIAAYLPVIDWKPLLLLSISLLSFTLLLLSDRFFQKRFFRS